jgi:hypothetical protein
MQPFVYKMVLEPAFQPTNYKAINHGDFMGYKMVMLVNRLGSLNHTTKFTFSSKHVYSHRTRGGQVSVSSSIELIANSLEYRSSFSFYVSILFKI